MPASDRGIRGVPEMEFDRATLLQAFDDLGRAAWAEGTTIEIAVYGGSALMLTFDWRAATKDVDGVFEADRDTVQRLAARVAEDYGWPADWLNDGVKGFLSARDHEAGMKLLSGEFPSAAEPGLRVFIPRPEYLFAMKCRAMRLGGVDENRDIEDIRRLATELGVQTFEEAVALVASFYPRSQLQPKVQFGLEEIFSDLANDGSKLA
jgi:hypothetical protein